MDFVGFLTYVFPFVVISLIITCGGVRGVIFLFMAAVVIIIVLIICVIAMCLGMDFLHPGLTPAVGNFKGESNDGAYFLITLGAIVMITALYKK